MALQALLETLDGVDDAVKPLYAEKDGKFALQVDGIDSHPEVAPLKNAYERTKADKTASAAKITDLERQLAEMAKGKPDEAATLAKLKSFEDQLAAEKTRADDLAGKLTGVTRDRALADALQGAGVTSPAFLRAAQAMLGGNVKIDGDTAIVETAMGPKLLGDFVKGWVAGEGKDFVTPAKGGGSQGSGGGGAGKTMTMADFNSLGPKERAAEMAKGTTLTD